MTESTHAAPSLPTTCALAVIHDGEWIVGYADLGESGYSPTTYTFGNEKDSKAHAETTARAINETWGVSNERRIEIISSSMRRASRTEDTTNEQPCLHCGLDVKPVPGGAGTTWVHAGTGLILCGRQERAWINVPYNPECRLCTYKGAWCSKHHPQIAEAVRRAQHEILADMASGKVPRSVRTFSELHDYVDANEYGGLCDEGDSNPFFTSDGEINTEHANEVQNTIDVWLRTLRTYEVKILLVTSSSLVDTAVKEAVCNLAEDMHVQAEDGVYTFGGPDNYGDGARDNEHVASVEWSSVNVQHITDSQEG